MSVLAMSDHTEVTPHSFGLAVRQTVAMAKRSTLEIFRQPALVAPSMIFPIFFAALGASSFGKTTNLPGFPKVDSFLQFSIAATVVQGVLFGFGHGRSRTSHRHSERFLRSVVAVTHHTNRNPDWTSCG